MNPGVLVLTDEQRAALKTPFGKLATDDKSVHDLLDGMIVSGTLLVSVGDATTQRMAELGFCPDMEIVDGKEQRIVRQLPAAGDTAILSCTNPPGTLTDESIRTVRQALDSAKPVRIVVDGEEDLFVLLACDMCPDGTVVAYGQPGEGMVVIRIDPAVRDKAHDILASMEHKDDEPVAE